MMCRDRVVHIRHVMDSTNNILVKMRTEREEVAGDIM